MAKTFTAGAWFILVGLVAGARVIADESDGLGPGDRAVLLGYARDTWRSVAAMAEGNELPADGLRHQPDGTWISTRKTTPTDIGSYMWSVLAGVSVL
jgi:hypothetical protein